MDFTSLFGFLVCTVPFFPLFFFFFLFLHFILASYLRFQVAQLCSTTDRFGSAAVRRRSGVLATLRDYVHVRCDATIPTKSGHVIVCLNPRNYTKPQPRTAQQSTAAATTAANFILRRRKKLFIVVHQMTSINSHFQGVFVSRFLCLLYIEVRATLPCAPESRRLEGPTILFVPLNIFKMRIRLRRSIPSVYLLFQILFLDQRNKQLSHLRPQGWKRISRW